MTWLGLGRGRPLRLGVRVGSELGGSAHPWIGLGLGLGYDLTTGYWLLTTDYIYLPRPWRRP